MWRKVASSSSSTQVRHKMLRNPNGPYASLRRFNHSNSTSTCLVLPKLSEIIMDKVWVEFITIWTILTHMTFCPTSVANSVFKLDKGALVVLLMLLRSSRPLHLPYFRHHPWIFILLALVGVRLGFLGPNRSDRSDRPGQTWPHFVKWGMLQWGDPFLCIWSTL